VAQQNPEAYQGSPGGGDPILPNTIFQILNIFVRFSYKFEKNESYQIFIHICKPNLAYFTSILQNVNTELF
jgi:hypothetical protein